MLSYGLFLPSQCTTYLFEVDPAHNTKTDPRPISLLKLRNLLRMDLAFANVPEPVGFCYYFDEPRICKGAPIIAPFSILSSPSCCWHFLNSILKGPE